MEEHSIDSIIAQLVSLWCDRRRDFLRHLQQQFGYVPKFAPVFRRLYLVQMLDGDIATRNIGRSAMRRWLLDDKALQSVAINYDWQHTWDTDSSGDLYITPSFLFYVDGSEVLLSERYGTSLAHRLLGVWNPNDGASIIWSTVWCSTAT